MNIETQTIRPDLLRIASALPNRPIDTSGIEPTIHEYFHRANNGEFTAVADLFAPEGCLKPPFDRPIYGRDAIAKYFTQEAIGMKLIPIEIEVISQDLNGCSYRIKGKVTTAYFSVNVCWLMQFAVERGLTQVEVKLLASLAELATINK